MSTARALSAASTARIAARSLWDTGARQSGWRLWLGIGIAKHSRPGLRVRNQGEHIFFSKAYRAPRDSAWLYTPQFHPVLNGEIVDAKHFGCFFHCHKG
jgi:hypothetical protein